MQIPEVDRAYRTGVKHSVTWLYERAREMNDPWAKAVLNCAADHLGKEGKDATLEVKAKLLEIALARAADNSSRASDLKEG